MDNLTDGLQQIYIIFNFDSFSENVLVLDICVHLEKSDIFKKSVLFFLFC